MPFYSQVWLKWLSCLMHTKVDKLCSSAYLVKTSIPADAEMHLMFYHEPFEYLP